MTDDAPEVNIPVLLKKDLHEKLVWFINNYEYEIGGWLTGEFNSEGILVDDILIPEQEVGYASVDTDGPALVKLRREYKDKCKRIIGHWHSHNTMQAYWSTTDEEFIKTIITPRDKFLFIVSSKSDGHLIRLELKKPFRLSINKMPFSVESNNKIAKFCQNQIDKKVKQTTIIQNFTIGDWKGKFRGENKPNVKMEDFISTLISYDKNNWMVRVGPLLWYGAEELEREFVHCRPTVITEESQMAQFVEFECGTKKVAKVLMKELKTSLRGIITQTDLNEYNDEYGDGY